LLLLLEVAAVVYAYILELVLRVMDAQHANL
jgi:hypothetical protein